MKRKLTMKETIVVASTLFGMFFGAGNLIFPVHLGQMAGSNSWPAIIGFCITAVTVPILAVAAIGNTHSDNLMELSNKVSGWYGRVFTAVLYLTIGPFFAIPRCASVSFTTGVAPIVGESHFKLWQLIFTFIFFAFVMYFSLRLRNVLLAQAGQDHHMDRTRDKSALPYIPRHPRFRGDDPSGSTDV